MGLTASSQPAARVHVDALTSAVAAEQWDRADTALSAIGPSLPSAALYPAAELHIQRRRWRDAARLLSRIIDRDAGVEMKRHLARNMACLEQHRPHVYQAVIEHTTDRKYHIMAGAGGRPIICHVMPDGRRLSLTPDQDPDRSLNEAIAMLQEFDEEGQAIGLCGIGDGYLLHRVAHHPAKLVYGMQQAVHLFEPDAQLLRVAMMIHDFTGAAGPIQQPRFYWHVGPDWRDQFEQAICNDLQLPAPAVTVKQSLDADEIDAGLVQTTDVCEAIDEALAKEIDAYYHGLPSDHYVRMFRPNPPRQPRVLLLTTRFSSVLQYAICDSAYGFEQNGWQTRIFIEPSDYHRQLPAGLRGELLDFKPDLVFHIDHHRAEITDVFPKQLPFVCWIQDHLPNLTSEEAGAKLGLRDYVLTAVAPKYCSVYGYPRRQCIDFSKLTRVPQRPAKWRSNADDIVFVSNASHIPAKIAVKLEEAISPYLDDLTLIREVCSRMMKHYADGGSLATTYEVRRFYAKCERDTGLFLTHGEARDQLLRILTEKLNNALYRQQALQWAADIAEQHGLSFSLYGIGWEKHPQFAEYARGSIEYGEALEELTRRTRINLQIVPYHCMHQRLLDGLVAGGFFLVRQHPYDHLTEEMSNYIDEHDLHEAGDLYDAFDLLDESLHEEFQQLLFRCACLSEYGDVVSLVQAWRNAKLLLPGEPALPHYAEVTYNSAESLRTCIERYIHDDDARTSISAIQREHVQDRLSYTAGMQRVIHGIASRLEDEAG